MTRKTHRTEIHIETHEIKIIRFGASRVAAESDESEMLTALVTEHVSGPNGKEEDDANGFNPQPDPPLGR